MPIQNDAGHAASEHVARAPTEETTRKPPSYEQIWLPAKKGDLKGGRNTRAHKPQANMPYAFYPIETIPFSGAKRATANKDYQFIVNLLLWGK